MGRFLMLLAVLVSRAGIWQKLLFQINQSEESSEITINAHITSCPLQPHLLYCEMTNDWWSRCLQVISCPRRRWRRWSQRRIKTVTGLSIMKNLWKCWQLTESLCQFCGLWLVCLVRQCLSWGVMTASTVPAAFPAQTDQAQLHSLYHFSKDWPLQT